MGESDHRRSSRARIGNQSQSQQSSASNSIASSSTSGRAERASRSSARRNSSSQLTTPTASTPSDHADDPGETAVRTLRSRVKDSDRDQPSAPSEGQPDMASSDNEIQEEDEAVRCICGYDDYPGPPPAREEAKHGSKEPIDLDPFLASGVPDDVAGFFLQCDICKVWQHGGCVGILNADSSPEEYFCDLCRKDFHKIFVASNGQKYSHYLPVSRNSRSSSRQTTSAAKDRAKSPQQGKDAKTTVPIPANAVSSTSKRRSTMNSRVVYDEEEELRLAIEASKEDAPLDLQDAANKRAKRGRSDSDEKPESTKRQRTGSRSPSPHDDTAIQDDSDDVPMRNGPSKKSRAAAVRTQREKAEKEEKDRQRAEAANKRKGRADRRRAEDVDSDPSEEMPLAQRAAARAQAQASGIILPPPPPRNPSPPPAAAADKTEKNSSTANKSSKKLATRKKGRNQYTKDRDRSPGRSQSREVPDRTGGGNSRSRNNRNPHGKNQHEKTRELTWDDMNRWVAFCTDFTQKVEQEFHVDEKDKEKNGDKESDNGSGGSGNGLGRKNGSPSAAGPPVASSPLTFLVPPGPPPAPVNGGSPLKNCIDGPGTDPPQNVPAIIAPPPPPPVAKSEDDMNLNERLKFIKNKIKKWHATYGPDSQASSS